LGAGVPLPHWPVHVAVAATNVVTHVRNTLCLCLCSDGEVHRAEWTAPAEGGPGGGAGCGGGRPGGPPVLPGVPQSVCHRVWTTGSWVHADGRLVVGWFGTAMEDTASGVWAGGAGSARCRVVKQGTSVADRQAISGRMQARESNVEEMTTAQRVRWLWREMEAARTAHDAKQAERAATGLPTADWTPDKTALLTATYLKTGVPEASESALVSFPPPCAALLSVIVCFPRAQLPLVVLLPSDCPRTSRSSGLSPLALLVAHVRNHPVPLRCVCRCSGGRR
jgi:hypothetical protein